MRAEPGKGPVGAVRSVERVGGVRGLMALALLLAGAPAGCTAQQAPAPVGGAVASADTAIPAVLATIDGKPVTMSDLGDRAADDLARLALRYRRARQQIVQAALDSLLDARVVAAEAVAQGKTVEELIAAEAGGSLDPSDADVAAWYAANPARVTGRPLEQIRPAIAALLRQQRRAEALGRLRQRLYAAHRVEVELPPFRVDIDNRGAPATGPPDAPVTLTVFSDFQCPYCGGFYRTLKRVQQGFGDRVRVVFRQFPLERIHPNALKAAEASLCAQEQGKFWALHDAMFDDQSKLAPPDLKATAARLGLDRPRFDACLDSGRFEARVHQDRREGERLGVTGTPALFLDGVPLEGGALAYDQLAATLSEAIERRNKR